MSDFKEYKKALFDYLEEEVRDGTHFGAVEEVERDGHSFKSRTLSGQEDYLETFTVVPDAEGARLYISHEYRIGVRGEVDAYDLLESLEKKDNLRGCEFDIDDIDGEFFTIFVDCGHDDKVSFNYRDTWARTSGKQIVEKYDQMTQKQWDNTTRDLWLAQRDY